MNKTHYIRNIKKPELVDMYLKLLESDDKKRIKELEEQNKELNIQNTNLNNNIKLVKETSVDRADAQRLEGKLKKKDLIIKELESQIDSTKINALTHLENQIVKLKEENKKLKSEHNHFNHIWKTEGITEQDIIDWKRQISEQSDLIKDLKKENHNHIKDIEYLKEEHGELITKVEKFEKAITDLYDDF